MKPTARKVRCPICMSCFDDNDVMDEKVCPSCKTSVAPQYLDLEVQVSMNWDEIRMLANWAFNYAMETFPEDHLAMQELEVAFRKLRAIKPEQGDPLTLLDLIKDLETSGVKLKRTVKEQIEPHKGGKNRKKYVQ